MGKQIDLFAERFDKDITACILKYLAWDIQNDMLTIAYLPSRQIQPPQQIQAPDNPPLNT